MIIDTVVAGKAKAVFQEGARDRRKDGYGNGFRKRDGKPGFEKTKPAFGIKTTL